MRKILLLNGAKEFAQSRGRLNAFLQECARETLLALGREVRETVIDGPYDPEEEACKILWADALIWQMPGWWMGEPWIVKRYIDLVFIQGGARFCASDGRHRGDPSSGYGTGGLLRDKRYMFSVTWNAPLEAFTREGDFFEGVGVDGVCLHLHKAHQFIGMRPLPTISFHDVVKNPQAGEYRKRYQEHLNRVFG